MKYKGANFLKNRLESDTGYKVVINRHVRANKMEVCVYDSFRGLVYTTIKYKSVEEFMKNYDKTLEHIKEAFNEVR
jgi:hypothetical protein